MVLLKNNRTFEDFFFFFFKCVKNAFLWSWDISSALLGILETSFKGLSTRKDLNILMSSMLDSMNSVIDLEIGKPLSPMRSPSRFKIVLLNVYVLWGLLIYIYIFIIVNFYNFFFFLRFRVYFSSILYYFFFSTKQKKNMNKMYLLKH